MSVLYDVADVANGYGSTRFYEQVREAVWVVLEASKLDVEESQIRTFYQRFAHAYIIGVKSRNPMLMQELLVEEVHEPAGDWYPVQELQTVDWFASEVASTTTFLGAQGTPDQHRIALVAAAELLSKELAMLTGFAGLIESLFPGAYRNYVGDTFNELVLVCE